MEAILEDIENPAGQSFKARKYEDQKGCPSPGWHIHPEYELVMISKGSGTVYAGSHFSAYDDGLLIFLGPNIPHMPFHNPDQEDSLEVVVQFRNDFPQRHLASFPEFEKLRQLCLKSHEGLIFGPETKNKVTDLLLNLCELPESLQLCKFLEVLVMLSESEEFASLNIQGIYKERDQGYDRINQTYDYVATNYRQEIKVAAIADQLGLTENSFCRFFKKMTQKTFIQFVNEYRINKAAESIHLEDKKVGEVMYESGFNDPSFFNRQFRKYKGVSPLTYLKQHERRTFKQ
ncbi:MAG: AraC family transcriptional regulator [Cytophagales bacterium]|nr:AraC family transcriptional regulator [Cytophagales bacterium]